MRLKRETGPPARIHEEILRVFAVFLEGFDMMVTGAESNDAQTRPVGGSTPSDGCTWGGDSAISRESKKLLALAVPLTCKNLKLADMLLSSWAFCSKLRSPVSETTLMAICC